MDLRPMTDIRHYKQRNCHGDIVEVTIDRDMVTQTINDRHMLIAHESAEVLLRDYLANVTPATDWWHP